MNNESSSQSPPILVVDDDNDFMEAIKHTLRSKGLTNVECCLDSRKVMTLLDKKMYSLILLDIIMPGIEGKDLLPQIVGKYPEIPVIVVTAYGRSEIAVECMKAGAFDYLEKPFERNELWEKVQAAINLPLNFSEIKTRSKIMQSVFQLIGAVAKSNMPVIITGETGVGKELIANAIHKVSKRKGKFVKVNAAGLDDQLFSDTLFGHIKGAFSEARQNREGMIKQAENGTLFLDEIGDLSLASQVKMLRVIDQKEYCPLGSDKPIPTNARIVTATNRDLKVMRETKEFRTDFYYRLQACEIHVPPLRDRKEDIPILVNHFLEIESKGEKKPEVSEESLRMLSNYDFLGNVRELKNLIEYVVKRHHFRILKPEVFKEKMQIDSTQKDSTLLTVDREIELPKDQKESTGDTFPTFSMVEAIYFNKVMKLSKGIKAKAAEKAGFPTRTFGTRYDKIKEKLKEKGQDFADLPDFADLLKSLK
jgi:DNA-binding NtrC family response regulator